MVLESPLLVSVDYPVMCMTWTEAVWFANALSERDGLPIAYQISGSSVTVVVGSNGYRLPTEAEWEYAARVGGTAMFGAVSSYEEACSIGNVGGLGGDEAFWVVVECVKALHRPTPWVGTRGRVSGQYLGTPRHDRQCGGVDGGRVWGVSGGLSDRTDGPPRASRGGSWNDFPPYARVAYRFSFSPDSRYNTLGFRLVRTSP